MSAGVVCQGWLCPHLLHQHGKRAVHPRHCQGQRRTCSSQQLTLPQHQAHGLLTALPLPLSGNTGRTQLMLCFLHQQMSMLLVALGFHTFVSTFLSFLCRGHTPLPPWLLFLTLRLCHNNMQTMLAGGAVSIAMFTWVAVATFPSAAALVPFAALSTAVLTHMPFSVGFHLFRGISADVYNLWRR